MASTEIGQLVKNNQNLKKNLHWMFPITMNGEITYTKLDVKFRLNDQIKQ